MNEDKNLCKQGPIKEYFSRLGNAEKNSDDHFDTEPGTSDIFGAMFSKSVPDKKAVKESSP